MLSMIRSTTPAMLVLSALLAGCGAPVSNTAPTTVSPAATVVPPTAATTAEGQASSTSAAQPGTAYPAQGLAAQAGETGAPAGYPAQGQPPSTAAVGSDDSAAACTQVTHLDATAPEAGPVTEAILRAAPAASDGQPERIEQLAALDKQGTWVVAEASFATSEPGIFVLRESPRGYDMVTVWGGVAENRQQIADYLIAQAPGVPRELVTCYSPRLVGVGNGAG